MKAIKNDGYLYDPPSWKVCPECGGTTQVWSKISEYKCGMRECHKCIDSPRSGYLPIRYTPKEWKDAGGFLTDDTSVWVLTNRWVMTTIKITKKSYLWKSNPIIIATTAGPPKEE